MRVIQIRIPESVYRKVVIHAVAHDIKPATFVRHALNKRLEAFGEVFPENNSREITQPPNQTAD